MATRESMKRAHYCRHKYERGAGQIHIIGLMGRCQAGKSVFINEFKREREAGKFVETGSRTTVVEESESLVWKDITKGYCLVEIPGFQNQPPDDGDGAIIREIAKFLVRVYELRGFAGLVYLHDFSRSTASTAIQHDIALLRAMIGPKLYDHTALVLNKYEDELSALFPMRRPDIQRCWGELTADNKAVIRENGPPRGDPRPIVELIWDKPPDTFALARELIKGTKLCQTSVGKVYQRRLKMEIDGIKRGLVDGSHARREALKEELRKWKKCADTRSELLRG